MKLPTKLRVLGHDILVKRVNVGLSMTRNIGEYDADHAVITVKMGLETSVEDATILHEVIHAIDNTLNLDMSEEQVTGVAQGIFQFLADNSFYTRKK